MESTHQWKLQVRLQASVQVRLVSEHKNDLIAGIVSGASFLAILGKKEDILGFVGNTVGNLGKCFPLIHGPVSRVKVSSDVWRQVAVIRLFEQSLGDLLPRVADNVQFDLLFVPFGHIVGNI